MRVVLPNRTPPLRLWRCGVRVASGVRFVVVAPLTTGGCGGSDGGCGSGDGGDDVGGCGVSDGDCGSDDGGGGGGVHSVHPQLTPQLHLPPTTSPNHSVSKPAILYRRRTRCKVVLVPFELKSWNCQFKGMPGHFRVRASSQGRGCCKICEQAGLLVRLFWATARVFEPRHHVRGQLLETFQSLDVSFEVGVSGLRGGGILGGDGPVRSKDITTQDLLITRTTLCVLGVFA